MTDADRFPLEHYRFLARYNAWFNARLYDACERLTPDERLRERGAFFGSIQATLNHLVWGDRVWLGRFRAQGGAGAGIPPEVLELPDGVVYGPRLYADWTELRQARNALDAAIEDWTARLQPDDVLRTMRYATSKGALREHPAWKAMTHFFQHQVHHRGQVTTLLAQAGIDPGTTDLIALA